ncbi:MAG: GAF domain-containing protein [Bacteroidota bacterium]
MWLLLGVFVAILILFNTFILVQNQRTRSVSQEIEEVRLPVSFLAKEVQSGINQVSANQRGYFSTGVASFAEKRASIWQMTLLPSLEKLADLKPLVSKENQQRIEELEKVLPEYSILQNEIDQKIKELLNLKYTDNLDQQVDSVHSIALVERITAYEVRKAEITQEIVSKVNPIQGRCFELINPLVDDQKANLTSGVSMVRGGLDKIVIIVAVLSVFGIIVSGVLIWLLLKRINKSINRPTKLLDRLALGELPDSIEESNDELNPIIQSGNNLSKNLTHASQFAQAIGDGNFSFDFQPIGEQDALGNALIQMRDKLAEVAQTDKKRNWATQGLAEIGGILRKSTEVINDLYIQVLSYVVKYIEANQGGLFILQNDEETEPYLELVASYAYNKQKFLERNVAIGEGLLGQAYLEKEPILLTEIPQDYINITSGLGDTNPNCILIVPLKVNEQVVGMLELASFQVYDEYQVEFVVKLAESIASAITNIKVNVRTNRLLQEAQQREEELRAQEEEMRQNMEELQATQEEMSRVQKELKAELERRDSSTVSE